MEQVAILVKPLPGWTSFIIEQTQKTVMVIVRKFIICFGCPAAEPLFMFVEFLTPKLFGSYGRVYYRS